MIDKANIKKWKEEGRVIISNATYKKSVEIVDNENFPFLYKGENYARADWMLTWGHEQFYELIP